MRVDARLAAMRSDVPGSAWPPIADDRHAVLAALVHQLDRSQWLPADAVVARQYAQLGVLAGHLVHHVPAFAAKLRAAGLDAHQLATPAGLAALPPLTRVDLQGAVFHAPAESLPPKHGPISFANTSGSTGEPVKVPRTAVGRLHWLAQSLRFHLWGEDSFASRFAAVRANMAAFGERPDWGAPVSMLFDTGPSLLVDIETDIGAQLDQFAAWRPDSVLIYPSNLAALLDLMAERGVSLPSVRRWRTLGETVDPDLRARVAAEQGGRLIDCYSTEEVGYVALECPDAPGHYHVMGEMLIVEVVDDAGQPVAPGETGRVLVTDLHNFAVPLIRYAVGDHAEAAGPCPCGRGLPTIGRILGRTRNMILKPDGSRHWPLTGYKQFREIAPIRQYQFRQQAVDAIEVRLVTERALTAAEEAALTDHIQRKLRYPYRLSFAYFDERLPLGRNGKFEEFLSLL